MGELVKTEKQGQITIISINRPGVRNCCDGPTARELSAAFKTFDADRGASVAILRGTGGCFCAGADLSAVASQDRSRKHDNYNVGNGDAPMGVSRLVLSKPVIAAVDGYAVAGGLELALWCDMRVAEEGAVFGVFCRRFGVPLIDGGTVRLPRLIGMSRAMDMVLTGRPVEAAEALLFGLANRVCKKGKALETAIELAQSIAAFPQVCMRSDRQSIMQGAGMGVLDAMDNEFRIGQAAIKKEAINGAASFVAGKGRGGDFEGKARL
jgi:enoyl-CoA hydratase